MAKKRVLFVNDEMTMGGVARILNTFLKMIDKDKYDIDLLVLHKRGELLDEIPEGINVIGGTSFFNIVDIPLKQCNATNILNKIRLLILMKTGLIKNRIIKERKKILKNHYDVEFSAKEGFCTVFTGYGDSDIKLNWVQVDYKESNYSANHMELVKDALSHIDMNIACSSKVMESYKEIFDVKKIMVVNNLIDQQKIRNLSVQKPLQKYSDEKINLICIARFHHQKGVDRLINVYAKLKDYYTLTIIGDGELREELHSLAKSLNVYDEIKWLGMQANPYADVKMCDLFVMPSLYEGYPTVTLECLMSGTPVLTTLVAGVTEQIKNSEEGWIVDNSDSAIYAKLDEIKNSKELLKSYKLKLNAYNYDNESILNEYYKLFDSK